MLPEKMRQERLAQPPTHTLAHLRRDARERAAHVPVSFERSNVDRVFRFQVAGATDAVPPCVTVAVDTKASLGASKTGPVTQTRWPFAGRPPATTIPGWGASGCRSATPFLRTFDSFFDLPTAAPMGRDGLLPLLVDSAAILAAAIAVASASRPISRTAALL